MEAKNKDLFAPLKNLQFIDRDTQIRDGIIKPKK